MHKLIFLFVGIVLGFAGCSKTSQKMYQKTVNKADEVNAYLVDQYATRLADQEDPSNFLMDYKILDELATDQQMITTLKAVMADSSNYSTTNLKSCPFIGKYGLSFKRNNEYVNMIISLPNCGKCQIKHSSDETSRTVDLVNDKIYEALSSIME